MQSPRRADESSATSSLTGTALRGLSWSAAGRVIQVVVQLGTSTVLMRILPPADFGLIAVANVMLGFGAVLCDFGFSSALIQNSETTPKQESSLFWINLLLTAAFAVLCALLSQPLAVFFDERRLVSVLPALCGGFLINGLGLIPRARLRRSMDFNRIATAEAGGYLLAAPAAIAAALLGFGVAALVVQNLTQAVVTSSLHWLNARWRPTAGIRFKDTRELITFGTNLSGYLTVNYLAKKADVFLIASAFGLDAVGIYSRAYFLMMLPITQLIRVFTQVLFPVLSSMKGDLGRVRSAFTRTIGIICLLTFPTIIGLAVVAEDFILVLFGPMWSEVAQLFQVLSVASLVQVITNPTNWLYTTQNRTRRMLIWGLVSSVAILFALAAGTALGSLTTLALSYSFCSLLLLIPALYLAGQLVDLPVRSTLYVVAPLLFCSIVMGATVRTVYYFLQTGWPPYLRLLTLVTLGIIAYCGLILLWRPFAYREGLAALNRFTTKSRDSDHLHRHTS